MRHILSLAVMAVLLPATLSAAPAPRQFAISATPQPGDVYPDRKTAFPGGVTGLADVIYSTIPGYRPLVVDIYLPPKPKGPRPLILYIHGGGWVGGHTRQAAAITDFPAALAKLASEGFVVASLEYRLAKEAPFPAALQDARAAIRFLKANAGKYGIDPARVGVWGGSAGGHLTALVATTCGVKSLDPAPAAAGSECVQGAVAWYGVFDFAPMMAAERARSGSAGATGGFLGCGDTCGDDKIAAVSPVTYIGPKTPPFLLIHGEADKTVPVDQSRLAEAKLRAAGAPVEAVYVPNVDHSFIGRTPEETRTVTNMALNRTFDFFHKLFDGKPK